MGSDNHDQQLFAALVAMFQFAAMQQMGKIKNPMTDTIDRNLDAARESIDMLDMLKAKTHGNLSGEETHFLEQVLQELKLNFVDESAKPQGPSEPKPPEQSSPSSGPSPDAEGTTR